MGNKLHVYVNTLEQLRGVVSLEGLVIDRIYVNPGLASDHLDYISENRQQTFYLSSPHVFRQSDAKGFGELLGSGLFKGVLAKNLETYSYMNVNYEKYRNLDLVLDSIMYVLNNEALEFYIENSKIKVDEYYISLELNEHEQEELIGSINANGYDDIVHSSLVYGRIPMMITANCIRKTLDNCTKSTGFYILEDRLNKPFPIYCDCRYCYNVIYNTVPLSLHKYIEKLIKRGNIRLDFTNETFEETQDVMKYFISLMNSYKDPYYKDYTTGHYRRGID